MNLYKISQEFNNGYDTYSDAVVVAKNEYEARKIHPRTDPVAWPEGVVWEEAEYCWVPSPDMVKAELIGIAVQSLEAGTVVCRSFHAG